MAQDRSTKFITMIKWIRTSRLSIKNFLSGAGAKASKRFAGAVQEALGAHVFRRASSAAADEEVPYAILGIQPRLHIA